MGIFIIPSAYASVNFAKSISHWRVSIVAPCTSKIKDKIQFTLHKYIIMLADTVGEKIKDKIQKGNCIADGWTQLVSTML